MPLAVSDPGPSARSGRHGRYRLLGRLGAGGMAEVFLARVEGRGGFDRLAVVKRILPHLARERAFVDMFLDEARIAARIRHRNVVQVQELLEGGEGADLAMVLEYVDGETLGALARALRHAGERLPFALAAFVAAEIAAGLHAAHTLTDDRGRSLRLVHRDVSPSNVMIGADGAVKLLDFGVAAAEGKLSRTRTGELKGKIGYVAPEALDQATPEPRWDVFALGVVLWELLTGKRLFRRDTEVATLRALLDAKIEPPSSIAPEVPPALDAICLAALERDPARRTSDAATMRRSLLEHVAPDASEALAAVLRTHCAERLALRERLARGDTMDAALGEASQSDVPPEIVEPIAGARADEDARSSIHQMPVARRGGRARWVGLLGVLGVVATALALGTLAARGALESPDSAPVPSAPPVTPPEETGAPLQPATPPVPIAESPTVAARRREVVLDSEPSGARVLRGGAEIATTPAELTLAADETAAVELRLAGHAPEAITLDPATPDRLVVTLRRVSRRASRPRDRAPSPPATERFPLWH